jgi:hypothetical protein
MPNLMPWEHYAIAQKLALEGRKVVQDISRAAEYRESMFQNFNQSPGYTVGTVTPDQKALIDAVTEKMDELGKKAMGIWAQGQLHATLANVPNAVASRAAEHMQGN